jgi:hypothetical protein
MVDSVGRLKDHINMPAVMTVWFAIAKIDEGALLFCRDYSPCIPKAELNRKC